MGPNTFKLGVAAVLLTAALFLSAGGYDDRPDVGFLPGDSLPSLEVYDSERHTTDGDLLVVVWSVHDATSRLVHASLSKVCESRLLSICSDADTEQARLYALMDGVSPTSAVFSAFDSGDRRTQSALSRHLGVYALRGGVIQATYSITEAFGRLLQGNASEVAVGASALS